MKLGWKFSLLKVNFPIFKIPSQTICPQNGEIFYGLECICISKQGRISVIAKNCRQESPVAFIHTHTHAHNWKTTVHWLTSFCTNGKRKQNKCLHVQCSKCCQATNTAITIANININKESNFASILRQERKLVSFITQDLLQSKELLLQNERILTLDISQDIFQDT